MCVEFLRNGAVVSGMPDGEVYYWLPSDTEDMGIDGALGRVSDVAPPHTRAQPHISLSPRSSSLYSGTTKKPVWYLADKLRWGDGKKAHRQPVQAIVLRCKGKGKGKRNTDGGGWQLMTGGAGGVIKFWSAPKDGDPLYDSAAAACSPLFMVELEARVPGQPAPGIKALDTLAKGKGELLVGTDKCDLWRLKLNDDGAAAGCHGDGSSSSAKAACDDSDDGCAASALRSSCYAFGLFANTVLQSENDSGTTTANLLARHLINELYLAMDDIAAAAESGDAASAKAAWMRGKDYLNGYLRLVNLPINARVGDKFAAVEATI